MRCNFDNLFLMSLNEIFVIFYEHAGVPLYSCENYSLRFQEICHIQLRLVCFELYHLYLGMEQLFCQFHNIFF